MRIALHGWYVFVIGHVFGLVKCGLGSHPASLVECTSVALLVDRRGIIIVVSVLYSLWWSVA